MKVKLLSSDTVKIYLDKSDMEKYDITFCSLDYKNDKTKKVFWEVINQAKDETGFNPEGSRLLVEAFPGDNGGTNLYVTRMEKNGRESELCCFDDIYDESCKDTYLVRFECFDDVCDALRIFDEIKDNLSDNRLYRYKEAFFLTFSVNGSDARVKEFVERLIFSLLEFGSIISNEYFLCHLEDYADVLIEEGAIFRLSAVR